MRRLAPLIAVFWLGVWLQSSHALVTSTRTRTLARQKKTCDEQGNGKACYDYGRGLWNIGRSSRTLAKKYILRACELKYQRACEDYQANNVVRRRTSRRKKPLAATGGPVGRCFNDSDLGDAKFRPNMISATGIHGQVISSIVTNSFWVQAGFKDNDVVTRINNKPFNSPQQAVEIFATSGKKYSFEVLRSSERTTLWYTCY